MNDVVAAIRMMVALNPAPTRKRDVAGCERATLLAFNIVSAESIGRDAQNALRLRCRGCKYREQSPILAKPARALVAAE